MSKKVPRGIEAFAMKMEECPKCKVQLIHDYYTEEEQKTKPSYAKMNLNFKKQRSSYCPECETLYINQRQ